MTEPNWEFTSPEKVFTATDNATTTPDWLGKLCKVFESFLFVI